MLRRSPLKAKRDTPRRNEGRVQHGRVKGRATDKTAEEARYLGLVASLGCLICGGPANVHHLMHCPDKVKRRDHRRVAPLCRDHHQGDYGVHGKHCGSERAFLGVWGVDLVRWATAAWEWRNEPDAAFWRDSVTRCRAIAFTALRAIKSERGAPKDEQRRSTRSKPTPLGGE
jgi:hypothetical protein